MNFYRRSLSDSDLKHFYQKLILPRQVEEKMLVYLRQGKISKWFSGYGQEAISVGCTLAMNSDEKILTMHRNLGVFTTREVPLTRLFAQFQGKAEGFTKGRDRSFHFGTNEYGIVGMISHLGAQLGVADGIALSHLLDQSGKSTLVFTGDGGASEGDFHEALNVAAVWGLPVIFVVENNQWGLSTPSSEQFKCEQFIDKGIGYGMKTKQVDGNNLLDVYHAVQEIKSKQQQNPEPYLLECVTFRMRGHEEASGTKYYPEGLQDTWKVKDPVKNFEDYLIAQKLLKADESTALKKQATDQVALSFDQALKLPPVDVNTETEVRDNYAPLSKDIKEERGELREMRFVDAISEGLGEAMSHFDNLVLMGQDIADYGGVFKVTEGLMDKFGKGRVRNTPLCESAILGAAIGLSIQGKKAMVEMQFSDFVSCGFNQIVNNMAKLHWRWGQNVDAVIRMPTGAGVAAGPFHSQSTESWFFHVPGLKIAYPSTPEDAKGMLLAAFNDPNPVLFFEHKYLYRSLKGDVPSGSYQVPLGKANVVKDGSDLTIVTYGLGVHWALEAADQMNQADIEIVDLRSLAPIDWDTVFDSVRKTGKVLLLHEDVLTGGIGAEISARISEHCFEHLDAPIMRCASIDTPVPFEANLEVNFLAKERLLPTIEKLVQY